MTSSGISSYVASTALIKQVNTPLINKADAIRKQNLAIFDAAVSPPPYHLIDDRISPDNCWRISCDTQGFIRLGRNGEELPIRVIARVSDKNQVSFSPDSQYLCWRDELGLAYKKLTPEGKIERQLDVLAQAEIAFSDDSRCLILTRRYDEIDPPQAKKTRDKAEIQRVLLASNTVTPIVTIDVPEGAIATARSADQEYFFIVEDKITKWSTETGESVKNISLETLEIEPYSIQELVSSHTGKWLALSISESAQNNTAAIYIIRADSTNAEALKYWGFPIAGPTEPQFSPDERWFATLDKEGHITVWCMESKWRAVIKSRNIQTIDWIANDSLKAIDVEGDEQIWKLRLDQESNAPYLLPVSSPTILPNFQILS